MANCRIFRYNVIPFFLPGRLEVGRVLRAGPQTVIVTDSGNMVPATAIDMGSVPNGFEKHQTLEVVALPAKNPGLAEVNYTTESYN